MENPPIDLIDKLITIGIILLILSLITEKITQFIRKYFCHASEYRGLKFIFKNPPAKENKEKEIMYVSISVGVIVAWTCNASFFTLIKDPDPTAVLFQNIFEGTFSLLKFWGIFLTGVFLSLGSKFFHDLLEMLFQVKLLKQKLNDEKTYEIDNLKDLDEYIATAENVMIDKAIKKHEQFLENIPGKKRIYQGTKEIDGRLKAAIVVQLKEKKQADLQIPSSLPYLLKSGKAVDIPLVVIEELETPKIQRKPGVKISSTMGDGENGSFGCLVQDSNHKEYILTCSHVALSGKAKDLGGKVSSENEIIFRASGFGPSQVIGKLYYCKRDRNNDTALISTRMSNNSNEINGSSIKKEREIIPNEDNTAEVFFKGSGSGGIQRGKIHATCINDVKFKYKDEEVKLDNMILISQYSGNDWRPISRPGDSGSVIFDSKKNAVGILVGASDKFTYALPIYPILKQAGVTII